MARIRSLAIGRNPEPRSDSILYCDHQIRVPSSLFLLCSGIRYSPVQSYRKDITAFSGAGAGGARGSAVITAPQERLRIDASSWYLVAKISVRHSTLFVVPSERGCRSEMGTT